jgi:ACS family glucarate transporter-like MFS transporter
MIEATRGMPAAHRGRSWRAVFTTPGIALLCVQYFANTYGLYFFITWLPTYLTQSRGLGVREVAFFSGLPLILSAVADVGGGIATDSLSRSYGLRLGRCGIGAGAYLLAALVMLAGTVSLHAQLAGTLIAVAGGLSMCTLAPSWATAIGLGGENAAVLSAVMNTSGNIGGVLSPVVLAWLVERYHNWNLPLYVVSGLYLMAGVCWFWIRPEKASK